MIIITTGTPLVALPRSLLLFLQINPRNLLTTMTQLIMMTIMMMFLMTELVLLWVELFQFCLSNAEGYTDAPATLVIPLTCSYSPISVLTVQSNSTLIFVSIIVGMHQVMFIVPSPMVLILLLIRPIRRRQRRMDTEPSRVTDVHSWLGT